MFKGTTMNKASLAFFLSFICIYSLHANTKDDAIYSAQQSVQVLMNNTVKSEDIIQLEYKPTENIFYCTYSIYNKNTLFENKINDFEEDNIRFYESFETSVLLYRKELGKIISYSITDIKYKFELLPLYDYGHQYSVEVTLNCQYSNKETEEKIIFYYFKSTKETKIVDYTIVIK